MLLNESKVFINPSQGNKGEEGSMREMCQHYKVRADAREKHI